MTDTSSQSGTGPAPACPRCATSMVRRTARRGQNQGNEFWGCSQFPKCRATITDTPPDDPVIIDAAEQQTETTPSAESAHLVEAAPRQGKLLRAATKIARTIDRVQRWNLELVEPDATGVWPPEHRGKVLQYVHTRDRQRCGLCAGEMILKGAQIEHVVPKVFAVFDVHKGGRAVVGTRHKSRLHKLDNLQAAHSYCNKRKGNTDMVAKWRHPSMSALPVADSEDGNEFLVPLPAKSS